MGLTRRTALGRNRHHQWTGGRASDARPSVDLSPVIDELARDFGGETVLIKTGLNSFARGREHHVPVLPGDATAMTFHRRGLIRHPGIVEVISRRIHNPFAVLHGRQGIAADRRFRGQRAILVLDEQVKVTSPVVHGVERDDRRRVNFLAVRHDPFCLFVGAGDVRGVGRRSHVTTAVCLN